MSENKLRVKGVNSGGVGPITSPSIVTNGLILNLDAGNPASYPGTGTVWTDLSGNGNNATLVNGVGYTSSNQGSLIFDGVNDYTVVNTFPPPSSFSIGVWVKIDYSNSTTFARIVEKGLNNEFSLNLNKNQCPDKYAFQLFNANNAITSTINVNSSNYVYIVVTNEYTSGNNSNSAKMYINGTLDGTYTTTGTFYRSNPLYIGGNPGAISLTALSGNIPVVQMYNRSLSSSEVTQNFDALKSRYGL